MKFLKRQKATAALDFDERPQKYSNINVKRTERSKQMWTINIIV